jgi:UDP-GlcNAc:undecaprenyl-phosphate GlcNAc-1-phosphate transferase
MLVGLLVGVLALSASLRTPATVALLTPLVLLTLPVFDTAAAIVRRKLTGRSIYATDRGHLHHCLLRSGLTPRRVLALVGTLCAVAAAGAMASLAYRNDLLALTAAAAVVGILVITRLFGHAEYLLIRKRIKAALGSVRPAGADSPHVMEVRLQGHLGWEDVWALVRSRSEELGLLGARLDVNAPALHESYHARWRHREPADEARRVWRLEFPLSIGFHHIGQLELTGEPENPVLANGATALVGVASEVQTAVEVLLKQTDLSGAGGAAAGVRNGRVSAGAELSGIMAAGPRTQEI